MYGSSSFSFSQVHNPIFELQRFVDRHIAIECFACTGDIRFHTRGAEVVVDRNLHKVGVIANLREVSLRAEERTKAQSMPNVHPTFALGRSPSLFYRFVSLMNVIVPHRFPGQNLWIAEQDAPERNVVTMLASRLLTALCPLLEGVESFEGALHIILRDFAFSWRIGKSK